MCGAFLGVMPKTPDLMLRFPLFSSLTSFFTPDLRYFSFKAVFRPLNTFKIQLFLNYYRTLTFFPKHVLHTHSWCQNSCSMLVSDMPYIYKGSLNDAQNLLKLIEKIYIYHRLLMDYPYIYIERERERELITLAHGLVQN